MLLFFAIMEAPTVVKIFLLLLICVCFFTVGMFAERLAVLSFYEKASQGFDKEFNSGEMLDVIYNRLYNKPKIHAPLARLFFVGMRELTQSNIRNVDFSMPYSDGVKQNIRQRMLGMTSVEKSNIALEMKSYIAYFVTIAVVCPLFGLTGTLYGMMAELYNLKHTANINVVGSLYASVACVIVGLFVSAIAITAYNILISKINKYTMEHELFAVKVANILSRELDLITANTHARKALEQPNSNS